MSYRSPEIVLDQKPGKGSDLWALACTIFAIRTGRKLFNTYDDEVDDYLLAVVLLLGKLPEPWWTSWERRKAIFEDDADDQGRAIKIRRVDESSGEVAPTHTSDGIVIDPRSLQEALACGLYYDGSQPGSSVHRSISEEEVDLLVDLLSGLMRYDPEQRLSAQDAMKHEWFRMQV